MMRLLLLVCMILLAGCFEIREEVDLNADGSGRAAYSLNLSESKANVANYMRLGAYKGREVPTREDIQAELAAIKKTLTACKGITHVRTYSDFERFVFSVSVNFDKVEHLNAAVNTLAAMQAGNREPQPHRNFDHTTSAFRRFFDYPLDLVDYGELTTMERYMLETARMVSVYRFEQPIRKYSNQAAQIAPNKRAIKLEVALGPLLNGSGTLANSISF